MTEQGLSVPELLVRALLDRDLDEEPLGKRTLRQLNLRIFNMRWRMLWELGHHGRHDTHSRRHLPKRETPGEQFFDLELPLV
ncbi:MAG TPA: hypothetical protein VK527_07590, partial [Candidatus Limnocylindrales bacterium]|nr:hypothetical protein [Candidatus Limnocylindrales bacterium]